MSQIIIITDTEEPGNFGRESSMAVINLDTDFVYRMNVLTTDLKEKHPDFSELRLWGSYAEYHFRITPDQLIDALDNIATAEALLGNPSITPEQVQEIRTQYNGFGSFKWPMAIEFDLVNLLNLVAASNGEALWEDEPETMHVDIEEIVAESGDFRCAAYSGDQQIYSKHVSYSRALDEVAI